MGSNNIVCKWYRRTQIGFMTTRTTLLLKLGIGSYEFGKSPPAKLWAVRVARHLVEKPPALRSVGWDAFNIKTMVMSHPATALQIA